MSKKSTESLKDKYFACLNNNINSINEVQIRKGIKLAKDVYNQVLQDEIKDLSESSLPDKCVNIPFENKEVILPLKSVLYYTINKSISGEFYAVFILHEDKEIASKNFESRNSLLEWILL